MENLTLATRSNGVLGGVGSRYVRLMLYVTVSGGHGKQASSIKVTAAHQFPWQSKAVEIAPPFTTLGKQVNFSLNSIVASSPSSERKDRKWSPWSPATGPAQIDFNINEPLYTMAI